MGTDFHQGATLRFTADKRLAAAAGGVTRYFADAAGMEADAVARLQAATLAVCAAAIAHLVSAGAQLSVEVTRFADRIEIAVSYPGAHLEKVAALPGVDRIDRETREGAAVTRLTKFIGKIL